MSHPHILTDFRNLSFPRVSGDEPGFANDTFASYPFSPRERG